MLQAMEGMVYFSTFDMESGYWQIPVPEEDRPKTAFGCHKGLFQWRVMPFGLKNAPATFQRCMDAVLAGLLWTTCLCYLDDIIIFSKDFDSHLNRMEEVLERLQEANMRVKLSKCELFRNSVKYLGHVVSSEGIRQDPAKIEAVKLLQPPRDAKTLASVVALMAYYRRFIKGFAKIAAPLYELKTNKDWAWTEGHETAFQTLRQALISDPILAYPDFSPEAKTFELHSDASESNRAIGGTLCQEQGGKMRVIQYMSRSLQGREVHWYPAEQEGLAIVWLTEICRPYLIGRKFKIYTDNRTCTFIKTLQGYKGSPKLIRWAIHLQEFDFEIIHRKGKDNGDADGMSRLTSLLPPQEQRLEWPITRTIPSLLAAENSGIETSPSDQQYIVCTCSACVEELGAPGDVPTAKALLAALIDWEVGRQDRMTALVTTRAGAKANAPKGAHLDVTPVWTTKSVETAGGKRKATGRATKTGADGGLQHDCSTDQGIPTAKQQPERRRSSAESASRSRRTGDASTPRSHTESSTSSPKKGREGPSNKSVESSPADRARESGLQQPPITQGPTVTHSSASGSHFSTTSLTGTDRHYEVTAPLPPTIDERATTKPILEPIEQCQKTDQGQKSDRERVSDQLQAQEPLRSRSRGASEEHEWIGTDVASLSRTHSVQETDHLVQLENRHEGKEEKRGRKRKERDENVDRHLGNLDNDSDEVSGRVRRKRRRRHKSHPASGWYAITSSDEDVNDNDEDVENMDTSDEDVNAPEQEWKTRDTSVDEEREVEDQEMEVEDQAQTPTAEEKSRQVTDNLGWTRASDKPGEWSLLDGDDDWECPPSFEFKDIPKTEHGLKAEQRLQGEEGPRADESAPRVAMKGPDPPELKADIPAAQELEAQQIVSEGLRKLRTCQREDESLKEIIHHLDGTKTADKSVQRYVRHYQLRHDGLLITAPKYNKSRHQPKEGKLVLPTIMREPFMDYFHAAPMHGHLGVSKTTTTMADRYYWHGMNRDIVDYVTHCKVCATRKSVSDKRAGLLNSLAAFMPLEKIGLDVVGPFKRSRNGNRFIVTIVDWFTKYASAYAVPDHTAGTVATCMYLFVCQHGCPQHMVTDRGPELMGKIVTNLCQKLGISKLRTTAYNPAANGSTEVFHRTMNPMLAAFTDKVMYDDWDEALPAVLFAYNTSITRTTGFAPFELMFGRQARTLPDVVLREQRAANDEDVNAADIHQRQVQFLREAGQIAREVQAEERSARKRVVDAQRHTVEYEKGQVVLVYFPPNSIQKTPRKLTDRWFFAKIVEKLQNERVYRVRYQDGEEQTIPVHRLRAYKQWEGLTVAPWMKSRLQEQQVEPAAPGEVLPDKEQLGEDEWFTEKEQQGWWDPDFVPVVTEEKGREKPADAPSERAFSAGDDFEDEAAEEKEEKRRQPLQEETSTDASMVRLADVPAPRHSFESADTVAPHAFSSRGRHLKPRGLRDNMNIVYGILAVGSFTLEG